MRYFFVSYRYSSKDGNHGFGEATYEEEGFPNRNKMVHTLHKESGFKYRDISLISMFEMNKDDWDEFTRE